MKKRWEEKGEKEEKERKNYFSRFLFSGFWIFRVRESMSVFAAISKRTITTLKKLMTN